MFLLTWHPLPIHLQSFGNNGSSLCWSSSIWVNASETCLLCYQQQSHKLVTIYQVNRTVKTWLCFAWVEMPLGWQTGEWSLLCSSLAFCNRPVVLQYCMCSTWQQQFTLMFFGWVFGIWQNTGTRSRTLTKVSVLWWFWNIPTTVINCW